VALWNQALALLDRLNAPRTAHAHCDVPCGIYNPGDAQEAVETVISMVTKIQALTPPPADADQATSQAYYNTLTRMVTTKEEHAEKAKREVTILWGDYFTPAHLAVAPGLHEHVWNTLKLASKCKREVNMDAAQQLKDAVDQIAVWFAETKK
jgi:nickel superoxide dismutase